MPSLTRNSSVRRAYTAPANLSKFSMNNHSKNVINKRAKLRAHNLLKAYKHHSKKFNVTHEPVTRGVAKTLIIKPGHTGTRRRRR
jgi:hypothetical protein